MFDLRTRLRALHDKLGTAGLVVAVIALIAAVAGTAIAASGLTAIQKKQVIKIAKKYAGKQGPEGKQGSPGTNGANGEKGTQGEKGDKGDSGTKGDKGDQGDPGTNGKNVAVSGTAPGCAEGGATVEVEDEPATAQEVCNGEEGPEGPKGVCAAGDPCTLPSGVAETGTWSFTTNVPAESFVYAPVSFSIPLGASLPGTSVHHSGQANFGDFDEGGPETVGCVGTAGNPTAPSGHLCVYKTLLTNAAFASGSFKPIFMPSSNALFGAGAAVSGAVLTFQTSAAPNSGYGTWAVTG